MKATENTTAKSRSVMTEDERKLLGCGICHNTGLEVRPEGGWACKLCLFCDTGRKLGRRWRRAAFFARFTHLKRHRTLPQTTGHGWHLHQLGRQL